MSDEESLHYVTELSIIPAKLEGMLALQVPGSTGGGEGTGALTPIRTPAHMHLDDAEALPGIERSVLAPDRRRSARKALDTQCQDLAGAFSTACKFLSLGRGIHYPITLEGALKLKEHPRRRLPRR